MVSPLDKAWAHAEVLVATTWACNLRCTYCFVRESELMKPGRHMTPALARRVIDALDEGLVDVESICVHLYGGEPLTNLPAVEAMLDRAAVKGSGRFSFAVTTNGTCVSDAAIELLERGNFHVILSIDGPPAIHDACRRTTAGEPTHRLVLQFLELLRTRTRCWVRGSAVVRSGWSLAEAEAYLRTLPVDAIKAQAVRGPAGTPNLLSSDERQAYLDDLAQLGCQVIAELEAERMPLDDRFSSRVLQLLTGRARDSFCGAAVTTFGITPTGDVLPCILLDTDNCTLGHVNDDPRTWVEAGLRWKSAQARRAECAACPHLPLCGGGCPALMPACGDSECELIAKNCEVTAAIYSHFASTPEALLTLAGID